MGRGARAEVGGREAAAAAVTLAYSLLLASPLFRTPPPSLHAAAAGVFSNATGFPTLPVVDATTGAEVKRITVQPPAGGSGQPDMVTGIGFLPVSAPALAKRSA